MPQIEEPETERKLIFQRAPSIRNQVFKKKNSPILEAVFAAKQGKSNSPSRLKDEI